LKGPASLVWCLYPDCFAMDSKKVASLPPIAETLRPPEEGEVLEGDEMCSFVGCRKRKIWTWTVLCRRTGQVVACGVGDRSEERPVEGYGRRFQRLIGVVIVIVIFGRLIVWCFPQIGISVLRKGRGS